MDDRLVFKYVSFVDEISNNYQYDSNIKHLLYLIIPAFVTKYSIYKEKLVLDTFRNIPIINSQEVNNSTQAFYTSIPKYQDDNIITNKFIVLNNYKGISLVQLMDSLVHEFNHAINSYLKEILIKDNRLFLRTGLSYVLYSLPDLKSLDKDDSYVLEEILNTYQTEEIINIIKSYNPPNDTIFYNTIYSVNNETDNRYNSDAYYLEKTLLKPILDNKTFISTLNNLRISGDISDIEDWFNNITGDNKSYFLLIKYLKDIISLEEKYVKQKIFKDITISKIKDIVGRVLEIINKFNNNCNYK